VQLSFDIRALWQLEPEKRASAGDGTGIPSEVQSGKRQMTEKEAWLYLADVWSEPKQCDDGTWRCRNYTPGLCVSIGYLDDQAIISVETLYSMGAKIREYRAQLADVHWSAYLWPRTEEGAKQRAEFCKTQAEKLC
jgi:hypothetical protein